MSSITRSEVERIAALARLELSKAEATSLTRDLDQILDHVRTLQALDTEGIEPTYHVMELATPQRADQPVPGMDPTLAVAGAPESSGSAFVVPKVIDGDAEG